MGMKKYIHSETPCNLGLTQPYMAKKVGAVPQNAKICHFWEKNGPSFWEFFPNFKASLRWWLLTHIVV